ncbi:MAG: UDP-N-acetylmuramate:L-alanyl-gamma-D-glutamyl-meso-diaminopimelate ligase [Gammaproteobacteria bacterium HGW-Gammaproteobacteria-8]|nr:MAG: UDP-N-acetylmuramate:L-alanyl-gamma-D-glutamyl-meso-diaminopimelate ligase [Gammaproteobacteria bacterium HGW-Gammaproteobacteria-8]
MKIHILGICGTFMGGIAALARADGHSVSGQDENVYPPMSTQLETLGIELKEGYAPADIPKRTRLVIIGNALSRGNPAVEHVLNAGIEYVSGPRWLGENYLSGKTVLAVAGTHGKTTTSSMLTWMLDSNGRAPGFLIGGVPGNFGISARAGEELFVVEADEYDTAFFDKRAKFVHYRPSVAILNNLEFDHADIYPSLEAIEVQFNHLLRTIPGNGTIIVNAQDANLERLLERGCWSPVERFGMHGECQAQWTVKPLNPAAGELEFFRDNESLGRVEWSLTGRHNALNACAAIAAAARVGVDPADAVQALARFQGVRRRMEFLGETGGIRVFDDFAHHPTAIRMTLEGLRRKVGGGRILVALQPGSNTMRAGHHLDQLAPALAAADQVFMYSAEPLGWDPTEVFGRLAGGGKFRTRIESLLADLRAAARAGDHVVFMSNRGFAGAPQRFLNGT